MFTNLFKKSEKIEEDTAENIQRCHYEGEVLSPDYDTSSPHSYPFHALFPHGQGTITYYDENGVVLETYTGEFDAGQYSGKGKLIRGDQIFDGHFKENIFVGE